MSKETAILKRRRAAVFAVALCLVASAGWSPALAGTPFDLGVAIPAVPPVKSGDVLKVKINVTNRYTQVLPGNAGFEVLVQVKAPQLYIQTANWMMPAGPVSCDIASVPAPLQAGCWIPTVNLPWQVGETRVIEVAAKVVAPPPPAGSSKLVSICAWLDTGGGGAEWIDQNNTGWSRDKHCRQVKLVP